MRVRPLDALSLRLSNVSGCRCRDSWVSLGKPQEVMGFDFYEAQANMEPLEVYL